MRRRERREGEEKYVWDTEGSKGTTSFAMLTLRVCEIHVTLWRAGTEGQSG